MLTNCDPFGIKGEGEIVGEQISMPEITKINMAIDANVNITESDIQEIRIEAQQNIINNITTGVNEGSWNIQFDKNVRKHDGITIYISTALINEVVLTGSGNINSLDTFENSNFKLIITGSGNIDFKAACTSSEINISGSGNLTLIGTATSQNIEIPGSGSFNGFNFESDSCEINIPGSGNCEVFSNNYLNVGITGSGNVYYRGLPQISSNITGSGEIINAN